MTKIARVLATALILLAPLAAAQSPGLTSTPAHVLPGSPDLTSVNLAADALRQGASPPQVPSNQQSSRRLLEGAPTDGWVAAELFDTAHPPVIILDLGRQQSINRVIIQPKNWKPGSRSPAEAEIAVSETDAAGFASVGRWTLADQASFQLIGFAARPARLVRLTILSVAQPGRLGIGKIAVLAPGANLVLSGGPPLPLPRQEDVLDVITEYAKTAPPSSTPTSPPQAPSCDPSERKAVRTQQNPAISLAIEAACLRDSIGDSHAPAGRQFLLVEGKIGNQSPDRAMALGAPDSLLQVQLDGGVLAPADPITALLSAGFSERPLQPQEQRRFVIAFDIPVGAGRAALIHPGAAGILFLPLVGSLDIKPADPLRRISWDAMDVTMVAIARGNTMAGQTAPEGRDYLTIDLAVENHADQAKRIAPGEFAQLIEDGGWLYDPAPSGVGSLAQAGTYFPKIPVFGTLSFLVPKDSGDLSLLLYGQTGKAALHLTPDKIAPPAPTAIAGPVANNTYTVELYGWGESSPGGQGLRRFVADLGIGLSSQRPQLSTNFDSDRRLVVVTGNGRTYAPIADASLRRPLGRPTIFSGQAARGEVTFDLPNDILSESLVLEVAGADPPLRLPLSGGKTAPAPAPAPLPAPAPRGPAVKLEPEAPQANQQITVAFDHLPGNAKDWISLAKQGSGDRDYLQYRYADSRKSGQMTFDGLAAGNYEVRVYYNDSYKVEARLAFSIAAATAQQPSTGPVVPGPRVFKLAREVLTSDNPITVIWQGFPDNDGAWMSLDTAGAPDKSDGITYIKLKGRTIGRHVFDRQPSGDYELRAYFDNGYQIGDRLRFTVLPSSISTPSPRNPDVELPNLTDVSLRTAGAFAEAGATGDVMLDGDAGDYDDKRGVAFLSPENANRIWLSRPYAIDKIRFLLSEVDQLSYKYKLLASPDGVEWTVVADRTQAATKGWQEVNLGRRTVIAFRFTDLATDAADGGFAMVEFAAYSSETPPALPELALPAPDAWMPQWTDAIVPVPINVALAALGATASSEWSSERLIDGIRTGDGAKARPGKPLVISLERPYAISRVEVVLPEGPKEEGRVYRYQLAGSPDGDTWELLADRSDVDEIGVRSFDIGGRTLKALRISGSPVYRQYFEVVELPAYTVGPLPVTGVAEQLSTRNEAAVGNLALALYGGRVERVTSQLDHDHDASHLIDSLPGTDWQAGDLSLPQEIVLSFPGRQAGLVDGIDIYPGRPGGAPRVIEIAVTNGEAGAGWTRVGRYALARGVMARVRFPAVTARAFAITILAAYGPDPVSIGEIVVHEKEQDGYASILPYRRTDFSGGINIAAAALGGKIEIAKPVSPYRDYRPDFLIDGYAANGGYWAPDNDLATPEIVLSLAGGRSALIGGVALNPDGPDNVAKRDYWTALFEVWVSTDSPSTGFKRMGRYRLDQASRFQVFAFAPVQARYVRLLLLATQAKWGAILGEVEVLEAAAPGYRSVLADNPPNLLDYRLGGHLVVPFGERRTHLIDSTSSTPGWHADYAERVDLPISLTFGFRDNEPRRFDAVGFNPKTDFDKDSWVKQVKVLVSDHPLRDFRVIGEFTLEPEDRLQYFEFPPVTARYVQLRTLAVNKAGWRVSLGEVAVREALAAGELSVIARRVRPLTDQTGPATFESPPPTDLDETEPNNTSATANPLPLGRSITGRIGPFADEDWYAIDTSGAPTDILNLAVQQPPSLNLALELFDAVGRAIASAPLHDRGTARADLTLKLPRGRYFARLSRPPTSIAVIVDRSESVSDAREVIASAVKTFARSIQPGEVVSFASMDGHFVGDFSANPAELEVGAAKSAERIGLGNPSPIYSSLLNGMDRLEKRNGERAIVIITDGDDGGDSKTELYQLWARLGAAGVRIYTIGYGGSVTQQVGTLLASTGGDMLRSFSAATGGRFYYAPSSDAIGTIYAEIAAELHGDQPYRISASAAAGEGQLVVETRGAVLGVSAPSQIGLILDASGSMVALTPDGRTRMEAAKSVLDELVDKLPDNTRVALRVYGHRFPDKPLEESCKDSELVIPFGPLDRGRLHQVIAGIKPRGETPIGRSLALLAEDFGQAAGKKVIVLVSDGIESCDPAPSDPWYPPQVVKKLQAAGLDVQVNIVGFGIPDTESETRVFLKEIAETGGGRYFDATGGPELTSALAQTIKVEFKVADFLGTEVASGKVGDPPLTLPEGHWRVTLTTEPPHDLGEAEVEAGRVTRILLDREADRFDKRLEKGNSP